MLTLHTLTGGDATKAEYYLQSGFDFVQTWLLIDKEKAGLEERMLEAMRQDTEKK